MMLIFIINLTIIKERQLMTCSYYLPIFNTGSDDNNASDGSYRFSGRCRGHTSTFPPPSRQCGHPAQQQADRSSWALCPGDVCSIS